MRLVVLSNDILKQELTVGGQPVDANVAWIQSPEEFYQHQDADVFCDLLFDASASRIKILEKFSQTVIISAVDRTLTAMQLPFVRINGWPGFLKGLIVEASCDDELKKQQAEIFFSAFHKKTEWLPDDPGFVSARIVTMIINEAYFALGEGVSTKKEIDLAMRLGTNYPFGPFEWCDQIGIEKVYSLLQELSKSNARYKPAPLLEKQILS